ncbi:hypothetical protein DSL72_009174 [Monilinia vaccinii-corymbosi]|uniref:Uncharacterized protein n=1 Tax=Monilinia vaccinii-corymbosi TaxID=61207 RepID=A0A8A3PNM5_9HELO|nr:hypothetical protein DSL72_009174 [Monilinia vaccinii-corymbosi]
MAGDRDKQSIDTHAHAHALALAPAPAPAHSHSSSSIKMPPFQTFAFNFTFAGWDLSCGWSMSERGERLRLSLQVRLISWAGISEVDGLKRRSRVRQIEILR